MTDNETLQVLQRIEARLKQAWPAFNELPKETQQEIFEHAVENATLAEIFKLEQTDAHLLAIANQRKENEERQAIESAKNAGMRVDDVAAKVAKEFGDRVKQ